LGATPVRVGHQLKLVDGDLPGLTPLPETSRERRALSIDPERSAFQALTDVVVFDETLDTTLQRVADLATREVADCDMAGITLIRDGKPVTAVFTDAAAPEIDTAQYDTGVGPCLQAFSTNAVLRIDDTRTDQRWQEFATAAAAHGVLSTLSLPLMVGSNALGALNLYSKSANSFIDDNTALVFASHAAVVLANAQAYWASQHLAQQLETALASRAVIEQAKGVLMATRGCSPEEAFALLNRESQHRNVKLREIAAEHVRSAGHARSKG
jgi:GAF domain-containing protein